MVATGAELLPFGIDLKKATDFQSSLPGSGESVDELSIIRLLEGSGAELFERYLEKSEGGFRFPTLAKTLGLCT